MALPSADAVHSSHADRVHDELRSDILNGRFQPGERLKFAHLQAAYGASASTAREALTRLSQQGLVVSKPQSGYSVWPLSLPDLLELTVLRKDVEGLALRYAIENGDLAWQAELVAAHHVLEQTPQFEDGPTGETVVRNDWASAHKRFHETLIRGCGSARLFDFAASLRSSIDLYLRWSCPAGIPADRDVAREHREILEAVVARDPMRALTTLSSHIQGTTDVLLVSFGVGDVGSRGS
jgi:DNA-binding GntR family transcriptional regulator